MKSTLLAVSVAGCAIITTARFRTEMRQIRSELLAGGEVVPTEAGPVELAQHGAGPPVLILHGNGGGYDQGLLSGKAFIGSGFRLIAPSRFGYLRTPLPVDGTPAAQADALAALLDALGIERVAVAAVSDGGPAALQLALRHPERTGALIMMAAKSPSPPVDSALTAIGFNTLFRSDFLYWLVTRHLERSLLAMLGMPAEVQAKLTPEQKALAAQYLRAMHPVSHRKVGIYNDRAELSALAPDAFPLERIAAPTLVIHGTLDTLQPFSHGQHSAERIPHAHLLALEGGGHLPVEHIEHIRGAVSDFLHDALQPN